jgi:opacity protein-like surface antigen
VIEEIERMTFRKALLAATMLALPLAAQAQPVTGFYIGAGAGVNMLQESDVNLKGPAVAGLTGAQRNGSVEFNYGWVGVLSLGYGYGNGLRAEIEGSYRENEVDGASGFQALSRPLRSDGKARSYGVMANAFYDFDLGAGSFIHPYVGAGLGFQWHEYSGVRVAGGNGSFTVDGDQGRFAYQAIVGAAFPINPNLSVTAEYRFMGTQPPEVDARAANGARGTADVDNFNHSLLIGLRYAFGAAPAPAPVVAPT